MAYFRFSPGALVEIRGADYRPSYANGRVLLTHTITGEVFRYEQPDGSFELPTTAQFSVMRACGDAVTKTPRSSDPIRNRNATAEWTRDQAIAMSPRIDDFDRIERMSMACQLLDERGVPNGRKAIAAALDEIWTAQIASKYGPKPLTADFVMQYVIVDHTWIDVHVVCPTLQMLLGRPWLTLAIDVKSRAVVGWLISFNDPSSWSVAEILRRIVLPKRPPSEMVARYPILAYLCGKPDGLILDNAVEFRSHSLEAAARDAGFSVRFCPIGQPTYRAIGERAIKTINEQTTRLLPGQTMTLNDARRWGYDAETEAVVMLDELEAVMNMIVALYNTEPHDGIGNQQPALVFERHINRFGINDFADFESFARDIMEVRTDVQLSPSGIRAFNLRYGGMEAVREPLVAAAPLAPAAKSKDAAKADGSASSQPALKAVGKPLSQDTKLVTILRGAVEATAREDGWAHMAAAGLAARRQAPIDPRNYGVKNFTALFEATGLFQVVRIENGQSFVADKRNKERTSQPSR